MKSAKFNKEYMEGEIDFTPSREATADGTAQLDAPPAWPSLSEKALYGLAGELMRAATRDSEADPAAVLITALVQAGAAFGANAFVGVGETRHPPRLMAAVVGASSRARKGTSTHPVMRFFDRAEQYYTLPKLQISHGPLSSGEGLVYAVRDPSEKKDKDGNPEDEGVSDKRLLVIEGELGAPLKAMQREGNTLSAIIRTAWDSGNVAPLTKSNRIKTSGAHICIVGHITKDELSGLLQSSDVWNGFANRFLWVCARRSKLVCFPQSIDEYDLATLSGRLAAAIRKSKSVSRVNFHPDMAELWQSIYPTLSSDEPGIFGTITARAEAQVIRIALVFALLDQQDLIVVDHLVAALAVWSYCRESARFIFGSAEVDPDVNRILFELTRGERSQTQLNDLFSGHMSAAKLKQILSHLQAVGRISQRREGGGRRKGKAITLWTLNRGFTYSEAEFAELEENHN